MHRKILILAGLCLSLGLAACDNVEETPESAPQVTATVTPPEAENLVPTATTVPEEIVTPTPTTVPAESWFEKVEIAKAYKGLEDTNPLITQCFGADPYAMVYGDKVYFYMTADVFEYDNKAKIKENSYGKINTIRVISTADMVNFEDHGAIKVGGSKGAATWAGNSWAPAAAWKNIDGQDKFFLYFADSARGIGVLVADSPTGPFTDPICG